MTKRKKVSGRRSQASLLPGIRIDKSSGRPLYWQLYDEIKRLLLEGIIPAGSSMPSPRIGAAEFGCSRHTVATAYDYLIAEGLLTAAHGAGTFVSNIPDLVSLSSNLGEKTRGPSDHPLDVSDFAAALQSGGIDRDEEDPLQTFGIPDTENFPYALWSKLYGKIWARPINSLLYSTNAQGYAGLRAAICKFAHRTRGIRATPDQVLVTTGTTQSLDLLLRALVNPGGKVWVEDPGRPKAATLITGLGMKSVAVPVDEHGLRVDIGESEAPDAKAALITASHHYPTGATLSLERRVRLLAWANNTGGWIFEDDYDGEIIADGRPILPIYSLGRNDRVVYMGTFSKSISPQLRLGYIICDPALVQLLVKFRYYVDYFPSMSIQPVLAEFIEGGHLDSYVRKMRRTYRERQTLFSRLISEHAAEEFILSNTAPTLFQPLRMRDTSEPFRDLELAGLARQLNIPAFALSSFYFQAKPQQGVIVGTGRLTTDTIPSVVEHLVEASRRLRGAR